jgi:hypothetical protein
VNTYVPFTASRYGALVNPTGKGGTKDALRKRDALVGGGRWSSSRALGVGAALIGKLAAAVGNEEVVEDAVGNEEAVEDAVEEEVAEAAEAVEDAEEEVVAVTETVAAALAVEGAVLVAGAVPVCAAEAEEVPEAVAVALGSAS